MENIAQLFEQHRAPQQGDIVGMRAGEHCAERVSVHRARSARLPRARAAGDDVGRRALDAGEAALARRLMAETCAVERAHHGLLLVGRGELRGGHAERVIDEPAIEERCARLHAVRERETVGVQHRQEVHVDAQLLELRAPMHVEGVEREQIVVAAHGCVVDADAGERAHGVAMGERSGAHRDLVDGAHAHLREPRAHVGRHHDGGALAEEPLGHALDVRAARAPRIAEEDLIGAFAPSEVKGLQAGLAAMANNLIDEFKALKSAGKTAEAGKLLQEQTVGAAIDKFVIDANKGDIALPAGVKATEVVSDAVAAFLKAGFTYSIDFKPMMGSHEMTASLEGGKVHWDESVGR